MRSSVSSGSIGAGVSESGGRRGLGAVWRGPDILGTSSDDMLRLGTEMFQSPYLSFISQEGISNTTHSPQMFRRTVVELNHMNCSILYKSKKGDHWKAISLMKTSQCPESKHNH